MCFMKDAWVLLTQKITRTCEVEASGKLTLKRDGCHVVCWSSTWESETNKTLTDIGWRWSVKPFSVGSIPTSEISCEHIAKDR